MRTPVVALSLWMCAACTSDAPEPARLAAPPLATPPLVLPARASELGPGALPEGPPSPTAPTDTTDIGAPTAAPAPTTEGPVVTIETDPCTVAPGTTATLAAAVVDAAGAALPLAEPVTYTWTAPQGWALRGSGPEIQVVAPVDGEPEVTVGLEIRDGSGRTLTGQARVRVGSSADGSSQLTVTAAPNPVAPGGVVTIEASWTGLLDGPDAEVSWQAPSDWSLQLDEGGRRGRLTAPRTPGQSATVRVQVRHGAEVRDTEVPLTIAGPP